MKHMPLLLLKGFEAGLQLELKVLQFLEIVRERFLDLLKKERKSGWVCYSLVEVRSL